MNVLADTISLMFYVKNFSENTAHCQEKVDLKYAFKYPA